MPFLTADILFMRNSSRYTYRGGRGISCEMTKPNEKISEDRQDGKKKNRFPMVNNPLTVS
jgi:hypothetical protein